MMGVNIAAGGLVYLQAVVALLFWIVAFYEALCDSVGGQGTKDTRIEIGIASTLAEQTGSTYGMALSI